MNKLLLTILQNSLITSAAVLLLALASQLLRAKTSPKLRYTCWLVVAACFIIPVRPSLFTVVNPFADTLFQQDENVTAASSAVKTAQQSDAADNTSDEAIAQVKGNSLEYERDIQALIRAALASDTPSGRMAWKYLVTEIVLPCAWVLGMLITLLIYTVSYARFIRRIKQTSISVTDGVLSNLLDDVCGEIGLKRRLGLAMSPVIGTPIVAGFFRPTIFLPRDQADYNKLRFMLMHEAIHIKSGHMWGKLLSLSAMVVQWFNPIVHIMNRAIVTESELACDASVLRYAGEEQRLQYGETVFQTAKLGWESAPILVSAFSGSGKNLKRRLTAIIERNNTRRGVAVFCALVMVVGLLAAGLVGCEKLTDNAVVPIPQSEIDLTPTNELVIYMPSYEFLTADLYPAIRAYEQEYPEVNVILEFIRGDEYSTRVNTELLAGNGPDIIVTYCFFPDMYKTMDSGAFLDLSSIMDGDENFRMEDYYQPVIDAGLYKGGRYFVPYSFDPQFVSYLPEELEKVGFDISKATNSVSFLNELAGSLPKAEENEHYWRAIGKFPYYEEVYNYAGIEFIDYEIRKVLPDEAGLKALCEAYKPYWKTGCPQTEMYVTNGRTAYNALKDGSTLFVFPDDVGRMMYSLREARDAGASSMVTTTIPSMDGGAIAVAKSGLAISSTSSNQLNAWNFIKTMISAESQKGEHVSIGGFPVNREALKHNVGLYNTAVTPGGSYPGDPLTEEELKPFYDLLDSITGCSVYNYVALNMFTEAMNPYFTDEKSYKECADELKSKLKLYLDE